MKDSFAGGGMVAYLPSWLRVSSDSGEYRLDRT